MTTAFKVERRGRKRKTNVVRDKSGKSRGEPMVIHPETIAVRKREMQLAGVNENHATDQLAGFTLGILRLRGRDSPKDPGGISQDQYEAGQTFASVMHRYSMINGFRTGVKSPAFIMVGGMSIASDPEQDEIDRTRRRFTECYNALAGAAREHGHRVQTVTYAVCVDNIPVGSLTPADYGYLRCGLNALGRVV